MFVITADQRRSRRRPDLVPVALHELHAVRPRPVREFNRTAGDEIQGVAHAPETVVSVVVSLMRSQDWRLGIGIGPVQLPLPQEARAGRGPAFVAAREAVHRAHATAAQLAVASAQGRPPAARAESALWLLCFVLRTRTASGWEVTDLLGQGLSQEQIAKQLTISPSAVSQRVRRSGWAEQVRAESLSTHHLSVVDGTTEPDGIPKEWR